MPQLTNDDIVLFEGQLRRLRAAALATISERLHQGGEAGELALANHFAEVREQPEADLVGDTEIGLLQIGVDEVKAIDDALERIDSGTFGNCRQCGGRISARRLRAQPAALRCLPCQEVLEKHRGPAL